MENSLRSDNIRTAATTTAAVSATFYGIHRNAGGFFGGVDYPMAIEGISIGRAITGGYVAAEVAAKA